MPPLTASRLQAIVAASEAFEARLRGIHDASAVALRTVYEQVAEAVAEVNAALDEVRGLLRAGLRDEALSMYDFELVTVARRLGMRNRADWVRVHGWLLEQGLALPAEIDSISAADLEAAACDIEVLLHDLDALRRLELERAPLADRLAVLRRLWACDPDNPVWPAAIEDHERALIEDFQRRAGPCIRSGDVEPLAEMEAALTDPAWRVSPPPRLIDDVQGAGHAAALRARVAEAQAVATELAARSNAMNPTAAEVDELVMSKDRFETLLAQASDQVAALAAHPSMFALARADGGEASVQRMRQQFAAAVERILTLQAVRDTRRAFHDGCRRLEYLCDHLPEPSEASRWLADIHRTDVQVQRCCQERNELSMPNLLQERIVRAVAAVESRDALNRRFTVILALAGVGLLLGMTAFGGWWLWQRSERDRMLGELRDEVAAARAGHHRRRPPIVEQIFDRYGGDPLVGGLIEEFDEGVDEERKRIRRFEELLASVVEQESGIAAAVAARATATDEAKLANWPESLVEAVKRLAEARAVGGLPQRRGAAADRVPSDARERFQSEENRLAAIEQTLATHDRRLEQMAVTVFDRRVDDLLRRVVGSPPAAELRRMQAEAADLRRLATAARGAEDATGLLARPRVPEDVIAGLEAVEERLRLLGRPGHSS
jgi:hypothetical protein